MKHSFFLIYNKGVELMRLFPYRVQIYLFLLRQQNDNSIFRVAIELKKLIPHQYPTKHKAFAKRS